MPSISRAERHLLDIGRHRQRRENDLALLADLSRRIGPDRPLRQKRLGRRTAQIVHDKIVLNRIETGNASLSPVRTGTINRQRVHQDDDVLSRVARQD
jgi:hypothetical protein